MRSKKRQLSFAGVDSFKLFGMRESYLDIIEEKHPGVVVVRGDEIILRGSDEEVRMLTDFFGELIGIAKSGRAVTDVEFRRLLNGDSGQGAQLAQLDG